MPLSRDLAGTKVEQILDDMRDGEPLTAMLPIDVVRMLMRESMRRGYDLAVDDAVGVINQHIAALQKSKS